MRLLDTFPANVHIAPNGSYPSTDQFSINHSRGSAIRGSKFADVARVIATDTTVYIAVDSSTGPVLFFKEDYTQKTTDDQKVTRFITVTNKIIAVKKDKSCGCGSRLKNWTYVGSISSAN
jgi:hypothetical protein